MSKLRQFFCKHQIRLSGLHRISEERVDVTCIKCGKTLSAFCGLLLKAEWVPELKKENHHD